MTYIYSFTHEDATTTEVVEHKGWFDNDAIMDTSGIPECAHGVKLTETCADCIAALVNVGEKVYE